MKNVHFKVVVHFAIYIEKGHWKLKDMETLFKNNIVIKKINF